MKEQAPREITIPSKGEMGYHKKINIKYCQEDDDQFNLPLGFIRNICYQVNHQKYDKASFPLSNDNEKAKAVEKLKESGIQHDTAIYAIKKWADRCPEVYVVGAIYQAGLFLNVIKSRTGRPSNTVELLIIKSPTKLNDRFFSTKE